MQGTLFHVLPASSVLSSVRHPFTGSPKTKPSRSSHQAMASKNTVDAVSWCTHSAFQSNFSVRAIHAGEAMDAANQWSPENADDRNEGKLLSGAIHCWCSHWAPASWVCPTHPFEPAYRTMDSSNTSRVRMEAGASQCVHSGRWFGVGEEQETQAPGSPTRRSL